MKGKIPLWLKLFLFGFVILVPSLFLVSTSFLNSLEYLGNLTINDDIEKSLKAALSIASSEAEFRSRLETYQAYTQLKEVRSQLLREMTTHAILIGSLALVTRFCLTNQI